MDESLFGGRSQQYQDRSRERFIPSPGCKWRHVKKESPGTWEAFVCLRKIFSEEILPIRKRNGREAVKVADETVVLMMIVQHNAVGGKGLY